MAWFVFNDAFLSIVSDRNDPDRLLVRSRVREHLEAVFPAAEIVETTTADYRFRTFQPRAEVARAIAERVSGIDYANFKNSVPPGPLHDFAVDVWDAGKAQWGAYGTQ